jgi:DNA-directed RNA polymerase specialized sigma24 family protein
VEEHARQDFADFAAARSPELLRLAYVLTGDRHAAEDLLQTALTRAAAAR